MQGGAKPSHRHLWWDLRQTLPRSPEQRSSAWEEPTVLRQPAGPVSLLEPDIRDECLLCACEGGMAGGGRMGSVPSLRLLRVLWPMLTSTHTHTHTHSHMHPRSSSSCSPVRLPRASFPSSGFRVHWAAPGCCDKWHHRLVAGKSPSRSHLGPRPLHLWPTSPRSCRSSSLSSRGKYGEVGGLQGPSPTDGTPSAGASHVPQLREGRWEVRAPYGGVACLQWGMSGSAS